MAQDRRTRWGRGGARGGWVVLAVAGLATWMGAGSARADEPPSGQAGVVLVGRSEADTPPARWSVVDPRTDRVAARVESRWGFVAVEPGTYVVRILPRGHQTVEVSFGDATVEAGRATRVEVRSGVTLVGRAESDPSLEDWEVVDKATGKPVARVWQRLGFTPVPPGVYGLRLRPYGNATLPVSWGDVTVEAGREATVPVLSGISLAGPDGLALEHWEVFDRASERKVAHVWQRLGATPLPPGAYAVRLRPRGNAAIDLPWGDVTVAKDAVAPVVVDSGVEVRGRAEDERVLEDWRLVDPATKKEVARVWQRWGFTPARPGIYELHVHPYGHGAVGVTWGAVTVEPGSVARVVLSSGVELAGRGEDDEAPERWRVVDSQGKDAASVWQRWGFTPLPPGDYEVRVRPRGHDVVELSWGRVAVRPGGVARVEISSGLTLEPLEGQPPPEEWRVVVAGTDEAVARVRDRFGFVSLPPGSYDVLRLPRRFGGVVVEPGKVTTLREPTLEERWASVSGAGRKTERERDPEGWKRLEEEVERAVRRAGAWLARHRWIQGLDPKDRDDHPTIGVLALIHSGETERDPALARRCLDYLLRRPLNSSHGTYATSLTAMALRDLGGRRHGARLHECATWLVENEGLGGVEGAWGYGQALPGFDQAKPALAGARRARSAKFDSQVVRRGVAQPKPGWDNSNTQFAVLGLHAAAQARLGIPREVWEKVERHFRAGQAKDGGFGYHVSGPYGSMTCSGVASLVVARHHLGEGRPALDPGVLAGLEWLDWRFQVEANPGLSSEQHYWLYGLERAGILAGTEFFGEKEWYPIGARYLLSRQRADGSWVAEQGAGNEYLDTCYAILFLRRATLPLDTEMPALLSVSCDEEVLERDLLPAVELIFDSSGSMKDPVDGRPKIEIARSVLTEVMEGLSSDVRVGLRLYGHRGVWLARATDPRAGPLRADDPRVKMDSELVVPIGRLDDARRADIRRRIHAARPLGWTPMVHSLLEATKDFPETGRAPRTVVLVSDGEETGGGKLEDVAAAYRDSGIGTKIHVVGFDIAGTPAERQLQEIAKIGGGRYYGARNSRELADGLRAAVPSLVFEAVDEAGNVAGKGALNDDPIELKPGRYRVRLAGFDSEPVEVTLAEGDEAALSVDGTGTLVRGS